MTDLTALCSHVVSAICQTPEYRQYEETLKQLKKDEPLYKRVTEYREKNFALQQSDSEDLLDPKVKSLATVLWRQTQGLRQNGGLRLPLWAPEQGAAP